MNPYEALTTTLQAPSAMQKQIENNPLNPLRGPAPEPEIDTSKASNPYQAITMKFSGQQVGANAAFDVEKKANDAYKEEHPGFVQSAKNAVVDTVTHPIDTFLKTGGFGIVDGAALLLNVPQLVLDLPDIVQGRTPTAGGMEMDANGNPVPGRYIGTKLVDSMRQVRADAYGAPTQGQDTIAKLGETVAPFLVGAGEARIIAGALFPKILQSTAGRVATDVAGNVAAGQLIIDPQATLEERKQQAKFDAIFGVGAEALALGGGAAVKAYKARQALKTGTGTAGATGSSGTGGTGGAKNGETLPKDLAPHELEKPVENPFVKSDEILNKSEIKYEPKSNLGKDPNGNPIMARTTYDYATGNAIVEYNKAFDNPNSKLAPYKQYVLDLEHGHIIDKRANNGTNLSAELPNPEGNLQNLSRALNDTAQQLKISVQEAASRINEEIKLLSKGKEPNEAEAFSVAYAEFRKDPAAAKEIAPTFYKYMTQPTESRFVTKTTTAQELEANLPVEARQAMVKEERVQIGDNNYKLTGDAKKKYVIAKDEYQNSLKSIQGLKETNPEQYATLEKAFAKEFETKVRDITGDLSPTELKNRIKSEMEPYKGKTVTYKVGEKEVQGTVIGKSKDGTKIRIADENGAVLVEKNKIIETRKADEIEAKIRERKGVEKFDPRSEKSGLEAVRELNKKVTTANNKETVEETLKGMREAKRINTDANLAKFAKDNNNSGTFKSTTKVPIWRAGTEEIKVGDFVTTSKARAEAYLKERPGTTLYKSSAKLEDLVFADGRPREYVYAPKTALGNKAKTAPKPKQSKATVTAKKVDSFEGSTGLDTGKRIEDRPSMNYDKINASPEVVDILKEMDAAEKNFADARISKSNDKIDELSRLVGLTTDELLASKPGSIVNAETLAKARQMVLDQAQDLANYLKTINPADATPAQLRTMREKYELLVGMQKAVAGYRSEAGTILNSLKREVTPGENATMLQLADQLKGYGLDDAAALASKIGKATTLTPIQRAGQQFFSAWYSAILSGPKTTARNVIGNFSNIVTQLGAKLANPAQWKEIPAATEGLIKGLKDGLPEFKDDLIDAITQKQFKGAPSKFMEEVDPTRPQVWKNDKVNRLFETVGNVLGAQDKYFQGAAKGMEEAALKVYSPEMSEALTKALSDYYGQKAVFKGMPKSGLMRGAVEGAESLRRHFPPARVIIPFVRTVGNIIDQKIDYLPIFSYFRKASIIDDQIDEMVRLTGYKLSPMERELAGKRIKDHMVGKAVFGTAMAGFALGLAQKGAISGTGPSNYDERLQLQRTGWRPNSIKVGDVWIPYANLGPLSGILSMVGNASDKVKYEEGTGKDTAALIGYGMIGWLQSELSASFMQGAADLLDTIANPSQAPKYFTDLGVGLIPIPAAYSQTKDMIFRQQYETNGIVDKLRLKLGLTGEVFGQDALKPRLDAFGQPMTADLIYGLSPSREEASMVDQFLIANDIVITIPRKTQDYLNPLTKEKHEFTSDEYEEYISTTGKKIYEGLQESLPYISQLDVDQKKDYIDKMVQSIRKAKRNEILLRTK